MRAAFFFFIALLSCRNPASQSASEQQATPAPPTPVAAAQAPEPAITYPFKTGGRTIFASGRAGETMRWQAGLAPCSGKQCPITVWLVEGETVVDSNPVAWPLNSSELRQEEISPGWGAGDPIKNAANVKVWASGDEERYVGTVTRPVKMGAVTAILVDQLRGFEHLRRHHELFVVQNRKLHRIWQGEEGAGPAWSSTAIVSLPDATEAIVYYNGFRYPSPAEPDRLEITLLRWENSVLQKHREEAPRETLVIGTFPSVSAAQQARNQSKDCLGAFWVLPASRFERATGFVLALPGATPERTRQHLEAVRKCAYNQKVEILSMR